MKELFHGEGMLIVQQLFPNFFVLSIFLVAILVAFSVQIIPIAILVFLITPILVSISTWFP